MTTENTDVLDRLRAANIAPEDDLAPPLAQTLGRIEEQRRPRRRGLRAGASSHTGGLAAKRVTMLAGASVLLAIAVSVFAASGPSPQSDSAALGVLQAAAATAQANPPAARFSGFVAETTVSLHATSETQANVERTWKIVRPLSDTEFEGRLESLHPAPTLEQQRRNDKVAKTNTGKGLRTDGVHTARSEGDQIRDVYSWRRPYGTLFSGALRPGGKPSPVPTNPDVAAEIVAAYGSGTTPASVDADAAELIDEAVGKGGSTAKALTYAEMVLTAPRVSPDVRAAVYRAMAKLPGVRVDPHASDPLGRPAAAILTQTRSGPSRTRAELLIDPDTARVFARRSVWTVDPGASDHRADGEPPSGEGRQVTTYRYDKD